MGSPKALLRLGDKTFLEAVAEKLSAICNNRIVVVLGHDAKTIMERIQRLDVLWCTNPLYERGQFSSLKEGIHAVLADARAEAVLVAPIDHPAFRESTPQAVVDAWRRSGADIVKPQYAGRRGHPVLYSRVFASAVLVAGEDATARDLQHKFRDSSQVVAVDDPGILLNIDTPEDYERLLKSVPVSE
jgi:CTP:molybdopterin cytidylyltransferase MocA